MMVGKTWQNQSSFVDTLDVIVVFLAFEIICWWFQHGSTFNRPQEYAVRLVDHWKPNIVRPTVSAFVQSLELVSLVPSGGVHANSHG